METAWFNPNLYAWIPGTFLGCLGGVYGVMAGMLVPKGRGRRLMFATNTAVLVYSGLLLVAGLAALAVGQPCGVWYGLGFPGLLGLVIFSVLRPALKRQYTIAEIRKSQAADL